MALDWLHPTTDPQSTVFFVFNRENTKKHQLKIFMEVARTKQNLRAL